MLNSSLDVKEQIRDRINIVDLVSRYIPLQRQGRIYVGRCPWHDDKRPSLQVNPERQTFKCWVCDIGGDIFSFMMQQQGVDFHEALELLADEAGIELKPKKQKRIVHLSGEMDENGNGVSGQISGGSYVPSVVDKRALYAALDWIAGIYHDIFLHDVEAEPARLYIKERGITDAMVERFRIGYSPFRKGFLLDLISSNRKRVAVLEAAGILSRKGESHQTGRGPVLESWEKQNYYDRFYGRVIFPIRDGSRKTVGFGGRILPGSSSPAKYLNSPETTVFLKRKMLYGLDQAQFGLTGRALIMEGYTDCIMAHQFGFTEAVAVLGTALGPEHIKILKRMSKKMILVLDGDEAGRKRAAAVLKDFVQQGADMAVLTLPEGMGKDPCEFLLAHGHDAFEELLENKTVDVMDHAFQTIVQGIDLEHDIVGSAQALDQLLAIVSLFPTKADLNDPVRFRMEKMIQRLAQRFRISEEEIRRGIKEHRSRNRTWNDNMTLNTSQVPRGMQVAQSGELINQDTDFYLDQKDQDDSYGQGDWNEDSRQEVRSSLRERFVFPLSDQSNETEEEIAQKFENFTKEVWSKPGLLPNELEKNYLEAWIACPELFGELERGLTLEQFFSPVMRQLIRLGRYLMDKEIIPTFDELMLRYNDEQMKNFLIGIENSSSAKQLGDRLQQDEFRTKYISEIQNGFERLRIEREEPKQISTLLETNSGSEEKMSALLELQKLLMRKQQNRTGSTVFTEENGPDGQ